MTGPLKAAIAFASPRLSLATTSLSANCTIMFASTGQWLLFAHVFALGAVAHRDWWLQGLPKCWQDCLGNTEAGCGYRKCELVPL